MTPGGNPSFANGTQFHSGGGLVDVLTSGARSQHKAKVTNLSWQDVAVHYEWRYST